LLTMPEDSTEARVGRRRRGVPRHGKPNGGVRWRGFVDWISGTAPVMRSLARSRLGRDCSPEMRNARVSAQWVGRWLHQLNAALVIEVSRDAVRDVDVDQLVVRGREAAESRRVLTGLRDSVDVLQDGVVGRVVPVDGFLDAGGQRAPVALGADRGTEKVSGLNSRGAGPGAEGLGGDGHDACTEAVSTST